MAAHVLPIASVVCDPEIRNGFEQLQQPLD